MGVSTNECPVSLITGTSQELVQLYFRSSILKDSGVGPIAQNELPIKVADAFVVIQGEQNKAQGAINSQESDDVKRDR